MKPGRPEPRGCVMSSRVHRVSISTDIDWVIKCGNYWRASQRGLVCALARQHPRVDRVFTQCKEAYSAFEAAIDATYPLIAQFGTDVTPLARMKVMARDGMSPGEPTPPDLIDSTWHETK